MSTDATEVSSALPKMTTHVDVWMTEDMKQRLDALLLSRIRRLGHRLSLADLGREAFLRLLEDEDANEESTAVTP